MIPVRHQIAAAMERGDVVEFHRLLSTYPEYLRESDGTCYWMTACAQSGFLPFMQCLVADFEIGITESSSKDPGGALPSATGRGRYEVVRWMLDNGARLNYEVDGEINCPALRHAVLGGHLDVVRLLVERGAEINTTGGGRNALSHALDYNKPEIAGYLRAHGAKLPYELVPRDVPAGHRAILEHVAAHRGRPDPLALRQVVSNDPPVAIYVIEPQGEYRYRTLVTVGMSDRPAKLPNGDPCFLELVMHLPTSWPLGDAALNDPNTRWPFEWLLRIAAYPHEHGVWPGAPAVVISNEESPEPVAPNTQLSCFLCLMDDSAFGQTQLPDYRLVDFFSVYPIYTEERDLERAEGAYRLVELFQERDIPRYIDPDRPNVAKPG